MIWTFEVNREKLRSETEILVVFRYIFNKQNSKILQYRQRLWTQFLACIHELCMAKNEVRYSNLTSMLIQGH